MRARGESVELVITGFKNRITVTHVDSEGVWLQVNEDQHGPIEIGAELILSEDPPVTMKLSRIRLGGVAFHRQGVELSFKAPREVRLRSI